MFDKIVSPAVSFMNRLPFKLKIILCVSVLFTLLILPSYTTLSNYIERKNLYSNQLIGLSYNRLIYDLVYSIQMHRELTICYLSGNIYFSNDILNSEKKIDEKIFHLIEFDNKNLAIFKNNKKFIEALSSLRLVYFDRITLGSNQEALFEVHTDTISMLTRAFKDISAETLFLSSKNRKINHVALIIQEKLPLLKESIGQMRAITAKYFTKKEILRDNKERILSLYVLIKSLQKDLISNHDLLHSLDLKTIHKSNILASSKLTNLLNIIKKNIIIVKIPAYNSEVLFVKATIAIDKYNELHKALSLEYKKTVEELQKTMHINFILALVGLFAILLLALYIFTAFYRSVTISLMKLKNASEMIAKGETNIHLKADTKDEIGNALLAFNNMSQKLRKNISFLDGYKMAIDETSIVSKTNLKGIITYANRLFCDISGYSKKELIGKPHNIVRHPDMPKFAFKEMWEAIKAKKVWHGVVKNRKKDGSFYIVDATVIPILGSNGETVEYIAVRHDITELEKSKEEIKKQKVDLLTGLPNRNQLLEDLKTFLNPTLLYINIDDFTGLNDFYGTKKGDETLKHIALLLSSVAKTTSSKLYRLNADDFLLLFKQGMLTTISAQEIMKEAIEYIEEETMFSKPEKSISITACGGIAFYKTEGDYKNLLTNALLAKKIAKSTNKKFLLYKNNTNIALDYKSNMEWINRIKDAIDRGRIVTYFQPIIDNKTGTTIKYESLVRMIGSDSKVISPFHFLDIAKKAKLYTQITKIVLDKTLEKFKNLPQYDFSINITVEDINDKEIPSYIYNKLDKFPHPERFIVEITESEEIKDYIAIEEFIKNIKRYGAKVAIDDFGTGYANFEHIIALNADFIKIDGSLIKNIDKDENSRIITEAIIAFSKKLGSKTIAEYVHSEEIYQKVKEMGADYSQGFYLGEPNPKIA